ncbi:MAG TPA: SGNH/GDSL hydrolase family protein, partial [Nocardioides sp.]
MRNKLLLRTAVAMAVAGGFAGATAYGTRELLHRQAAQARRAIGKPLGESAPAGDRHYKKKYGEP